MRPAVYAHRVVVDAGDARLVDGFDLTVGPGNWVTIVGPNGAGKTTLLRALAGLTRSTGRIELLGTPLTELSARQRARCIALVPQVPLTPPGMSVAHYVLLGRTAHLGPLANESRHDLAVIGEALAQLDLADLADRPLGTLSGGERQRAVLARALAQEASLLFLDEPTTALDIGHQQEILELVDRLRRRLGLTVVSTTHDLTLAAQYSDHLILMNRGQIAISGPPVQVLTSSQLRKYYGARVDVIRHHGNLVVVPRRDQEREDEST